MCNTFQKIRAQTRLALPASDEYIFKLGVALYGIASVQNFITEIITLLVPTEDRTILQDKSASEIVTKLHNIILSSHDSEIKKLLQETVDWFEVLKDARNDLMHSYPITSSTDYKTQILHRRKDTKGKYFEITDSFLNTIISSFDKIEDNLYRIREIKRNNHE